MMELPEPHSFYTLVWEIARQIPPGRVSTYGQIASMIPAPEGVEPPQYDRVRARWVGRAMHAAPPDVPWQRVINSQGKISMPAASVEAQKQRLLLEMEDIVFDEQGRVDLNCFGWDGPAAQWLIAHDLLPPRSLKRPSDEDDLERGTQLSLL